jgi:hypothetical protein
MFLGHFGAGLAAKRLTPYTSLGTLIFSVQLLDLAWPTLLALGVERARVVPGHTVVTPLAFDYYPWSHSLLMACAWAALLAAGYAVFRRYPRGAWVLGAGVVSHWVLDVVVHGPDLPLAPGVGPAVGLGLWNSLRVTLLLEAALFFGGLWVYVRNTEPTDRLGRHALAGFVAVLLIVYALSVFGPPPPGIDAVATAGHAQWLLVGWAAWIDRHRVPVRQW